MSSLGLLVFVVLTVIATVAVIGTLFMDFPMGDSP